MISNGLFVIDLSSAERFFAVQDEPWVLPWSMISASLNSTFLLFLVLISLSSLKKSDFIFSFLCYADGNCKGMISAFILIILIGNYNSNLISIFISPIWILKMIIMIAECSTNSACSGDKPVCVAGSCKGMKQIVI